MPSPEFSVLHGLFHMAPYTDPPPTAISQSHAQHVGKCHAEKGSGALPGDVASKGGRVLKMDTSQGASLGLCSALLEGFWHSQASVSPDGRISPAYAMDA